MILCSGPGGGKTRPSKRGLLRTQRVLTSEETGTKRLPAQDSFRRLAARVWVPQKHTLR